MDIQLKSLMNDYVADYMQKEHFEFVVKNALPVIWFGNLEKYKASKQKIVTVGINPSNQEFPSITKPRFDVPSLLPENEEKIYDTLNNYFVANPYRGWFTQYEKILEGSFDCSYGGQLQAYNAFVNNTAIHIDCCSAIATNPPWGKLSDSQKQKILRVDLFNKLVDYLDPDIILFSASEEMFNQTFFSKYIPNKRSLQFEDHKKHAYIRTYKKGKTTLIWGRNHGIPFAHMTIDEINQTIKNFMSNGLLD